MEKGNIVQKLCNTPGDYHVVVKVVDGFLFVWDYKVLNNSLHLIFEPFEGIEKEDYVTVRELIRYIENYTIASIVSENTGEEFTDLELDSKNKTIKFY